MKRFTELSGLVVLLVAGMVGCGPAVNKQGLPKSVAVKVLHLGAADPVDHALSFFLDAVEQQSGHRLRVDVDKLTYNDGTSGGEARLVGDVRAGRIDFAYIPSRDWAATGDPGFRAVQSPFEITTTEASVALAGSPVAVDLLNGMGRYDVVGLGLIPSEPRRLVTKVPLLTSADLKGSRVRISDSDQTARLISALGAHPVQGITPREANTALEGDGLDGVETAPLPIGQNSFSVRAPYLTSFALMPKFEILAASKKAWAMLSEQDRRAVHAAAAQTLRYASKQVLQDEKSELAQLCSIGLVVVRPSHEALVEMAHMATAAAVSDAPTKLALARIAAAVPAVGLHDDASPLPSSCQVATSEEQARSLHRSAQNGSPSPSVAAPGASIPLGTYQYKLTKEQMAAAGLTGVSWQADVTYTQTFEADGTFRETQQPDYPDQGPLSGKYIVSGDTVTFIYDFSPSGSLSPDKVRWSFYQGTLTFSVISVQDPGSRLIYAQPWRKIA